MKRDVDPLAERDDLQRFREAYLAMARHAKYRPQAPSDGCGTIYLTDEQFADKERLWQEASEYAVRFFREEDTCEFNIGHFNYSTGLAFVWTIEAARLLCAGSYGMAEATALKLLKMAVKQVEEVLAGQKRT